MNEAVLSLASLPKNGSTITVNATVSSSNLFNDNITIGGGYAGCLDHLTVNRQPVFLLNPLEDIDIYTCGPRLPSETAREFENGAWFFGAGSYIQLFSQPFELIQFEFRTLDSSGVLLFYPNNEQQYILLYLSEGRLAVDYNLSPLDFLHLETESTFNSGLWYQVSLRISDQNITVTINDTLTLITSSTIADIGFTPTGILLLGGVSANYSAEADGLASSLSIAGCMRNLEFDGLLINIQESISNRVDFSGCPQVVASGVRFMGTGRAEYLVTSQQFHNLTFTFRTTQLAALLFCFSEFSISIFHTKLRLDVSDEFVLISDEPGLNDNIQHTGSVQLSSFGNVSM